MYMVQMNVTILLQSQNILYVVKRMQDIVWMDEVYSEQSTMISVVDQGP